MDIEINIKNGDEVVGSFNIKTFDDAIIPKLITKDVEPIGLIYGAHPEEFRMLKDNREISQRQINKIKNSIAKIGILNAPIKVDDNMCIIDGQHMYSFLKERISQIPFTISNTAGFNKEQLQLDIENAKAGKKKIKTKFKSAELSNTAYSICSTFNDSQSKWSIWNHIYALANYDDDYLIIKAEHKYHPMYSASLLYGILNNRIIQGSGRCEGNSLKKGFGKIDYNAYQNADDRFEFIDANYNILRQIIPSYSHVEKVTMISWCREYCKNNDGDLKSFDERILSLSNSNNQINCIEDGMKLISDTFNYKKKKENRINFLEVWEKESFAPLFRTYPVEFKKTADYC